MSANREALESLDRLLAKPPTAVDIAVWFAMHLPVIRAALQEDKRPAGWHGGMDPKGDVL